MKHIFKFIFGVITLPFLFIMMFFYTICGLGIKCVNGIKGLPDEDEEDLLDI